MPPIDTVSLRVASNLLNLSTKLEVSPQHPSQRIITTSRPNGICAAYSHTACHMTNYPSLPGIRPQGSIVTSGAPITAQSQS